MSVLLLQSSAQALSTIDKMVPPTIVISTFKSRTITASSIGQQTAQNLRMSTHKRVGTC
jgi:hypothetical protein